LEPILVGASIVAPFLLMRLEHRGTWLARRIGIAMLGLAVILFCSSVFFGIVLP
jgi:hypothetical protein